MALQHMTIKAFPSNSIFSLFARRFYRNFTNSSPTSKPGFLALENVQKLLQEQQEVQRIARINSKIPVGLSSLFTTCDRNRPLPSLKGPIQPHEIGNKERFDV